MFSIQSFDEYFRVVGYADGGDWLVTPGPHSIRSYGIAEDHLWVYDEHADLHIFNMPRRCRAAKLAIGEKHKFGHSCLISASGNGRLLYVLVAQEKTYALKIVDPADGKVTATHEGFTSCLDRQQVPRAALGCLMRYSRTAGNDIVQNRTVARHGR